MAFYNRWGDINYHNIYYTMNLVNFINLIIITLIIYFIVRHLNRGQRSLEFLTAPASKETKKAFEAFVNSYNNADSGPTTTALSNPTKCSKSVDIKAGNYFLSNENDVNFGNNVLNTNNFYQLHPDSDDGSLIPKKLEQIEKNLCVEGASTKLSADTRCFSQPNTGKTTKVGNPAEGGKGKNDSEEWQYKNELPMNGGFILEGLQGYNSTGVAFANYSDKISNASCDGTDSLNCNKEPDDIRMGMGKPNEEYRRTR
jgi:hypothetical protein